jgi:hypothetical protein
MDGDDPDGSSDRGDRQQGALLGETELHGHGSC